MKIALTLALAATTSLTLAASALAQTAAPMAASSIQSGPPISGICVFSAARAVETSAVGLSVSVRLKALAQTADAELNAAATGFQQEQAAVQAARSTMNQDQFDQRALALRQKYEALQRLQQQRAQELQATRDKQLQRIGLEIDPILKNVYTGRNCSMLVNADVTFNIFNQQMDITPAVITQLNTKLTSLSFDRERLDQQPGQPTGVAAQQPTAAAGPKKHK